MFGHFRKEGRSISVAGPSNLWGVFMETTHPDSQAGIAMATEPAGLEGEERKMATDSTGCPREIDQRPRHTLAGVGVSGLTTPLLWAAVIGARALGVVFQRKSPEGKNSHRTLLLRRPVSCESAFSIWHAFPSCAAR